MAKGNLPELQRRQKWNNPRRNLALGDIVLMVDYNSPRSSWPLGRVVRVNPNSSDAKLEYRAKV